VPLLPRCNFTPGHTVGLPPLYNVDHRAAGKDYTVIVPFDDALQIKANACEPVRLVARSPVSSVHELTVSFRYSCFECTEGEDLPSDTPACLSGAGDRVDSTCCIRDAWGHHIGEATTSYRSRCDSARY